MNLEDRGYNYDSARNLHYRTNNGSLQTYKVDNKNQLTNEPNFFVQAYDDNGTPPTVATMIGMSTTMKTAW